MATADGGARAWRSEALPRYARRTRQVEALIAGAHLAGANTRRVKGALSALFEGAVGKDVVSRAWRKVRTDWNAWNKRDLADEDIVRLVLDGTVVRVRLDRKAMTISLLGVLGVRRDGQKALLSVRTMGGESEAAWRGVLDDLIGRSLRTPEFLMVDGGAGLDRALAALWPDVPVQRCTARKHRTLPAHAPDTLHEEISADDTGMIYAATPKAVESRRRALPLASGGCAARQSPQAWQKQASACSASSGGPRRSGRRRAPPTPSSGCTRNSSEGSRRRPCCRRPRRPRCCSGPCSRQARSPCARWTDGRPWPPRLSQSPRLTWQSDNRTSQLDRKQANQAFSTQGATAPARRARRSWPVAWRLWCQGLHDRRRAGPGDRLRAGAGPGV